MIRSYPKGPVDYPQCALGMFGGHVETICLRDEMVDVDHSETAYSQAFRHPSRGGA